VAPTHPGATILREKPFPYRKRKKLKKKTEREKGDILKEL
jgi:hypothetical protein